MSEAYARLLPPVTDANRSFWDGCAAGELRLQYCSDCGKPRYPDSPLCPNCLSERSEWRPASGRAKLWSWITMHQRYFDAFAEKLPYLIAFVRLDGGVFMTSSLVDPPATLTVDAPLQVEFAESPAGRVIPVFRVVV